MKELTGRQLHDRKIYYQGYVQSMTDVMNLFREQKEITGNKIYLDEDKIGSVLAGLMVMVETYFDRGYLYYDEEKRKFMCEEREFADEV